MTKPEDTLPAASGSPLDVGVRARSLRPLTDDERQLLHDNPNTDDVVDFVALYAMEAVLAAVAAERKPDAVIRRALIVAALRPANQGKRPGEMRSAAVSLFGIDAVLDATARPNLAVSGCTQSAQVQG